MSRGRRPRPGNHWSESHKALLVKVAAIVASRYQGFITDESLINELVNEGWRLSLRHRREEELHGCFRHVYKVMNTYFRSKILGDKKYYEKKGYNPSFISLEQVSKLCNIGVEERLQRVDAKLDVEIILNLDCLTEQEKYVLHRLFVKAESLKTVSKEMGLSVYLIGQTRNIAIKKIKDRLSVEE